MTTRHLAASCALSFGTAILTWACLLQGAGYAAETDIPDLPQVRAGDASNRVYRAYAELSKSAGESTNGGIVCEFAKACFEYADFATNNAQRAALAEQGIAASRRVILLTPDSAAAYYY